MIRTEEKARRNPLLRTAAYFHLCIVCF